jgi:signal transduction histidine kinase
VRNWPVRLKVFAIVLIPLALAIAFGGVRIYEAVNSEREMRLAVDRVALVPAVENYTAALQRAITAYSSGSDIQPAETAYENSKSTLQSRIKGTAAAVDIRTAATGLLDSGQKLLDAVSSNAISVPDRVSGYAPILLTAQDVIDGSARVDDERIRTEARGLSAAVGVRGQMFMQELLVDQGGELPDPQLRQSVVTLAGGEPATLLAVNQLVGMGSAEAEMLRNEMLKRSAILSNPDDLVAGNAALRESMRATDKIVGELISATSPKLTGAMQELADQGRHTVIRDSVLVIAGLVLALLTMSLVARSLVRPLRDLRDGALKVAHTDLEAGINRVRAGDEREPEPLPIYTTEEIGQVAHAVDELHTQALLLAGEEAQLRSVVNEMFETMSRRNRSLIDQQLSLISELGDAEQNPERLETLTRLDHLATRMRRTSANLLVVAGATVSQDKRESLPLASAVAAAISEVKDYQRVEVADVPDVEIIGKVSGDVIHMTAELIDNALRYSPPVAQVRVTVTHTDNAGLLIEIQDDGIGMTESDLRIANTRLYSGGEVSPDNTRHMGLFVVSRLAHMHKLEVRLRHTIAGDPSSGTTAELYLPPEVLEHGSPIDIAKTPEAVDSPWFGAREPHSESAGEAPSDMSPFLGARERVPDEPQLNEEEADLIYRNMMAEWTVDPHDLVVPQDWESVWDSGWETAAEVENVPVEEHTEHGLPVREPGARLVPGAVESPGPARNGVPSEHDRPNLKKQQPATNEQAANDGQEPT